MRMFFCDTACVTWDEIKSPSRLTFRWVNTKLWSQGLLRTRLRLSHRWSITVFNQLHPIKGKALICLSSTYNQLNCSTSLPEAKISCFLFPTEEQQKERYSNEVVFKVFLSFCWKMILPSLWLLMHLQITYVTTCCSFELNANHQSNDRKNFL